MPGLRTTIPTSFTGSLPYLANDAILTTGSLILVDVSHPDGGLGTAGIPTDSTFAPNVAWREAARTLGSGDATSLRLPIRCNGWSTNPSLMKIERTGKGGIHSITSKATDPGSTPVFYMPLNIAGSPFGQFILDNTGANSADPKHLFYASAWVRQTRLPFSTTNNHAHANSLTSSTAPSSNYIMYHGHNNNPFVSGVTTNFNKTDVANPQFTAQQSLGYWFGTRATALTGSTFRMGQLGMADMYSYTADIRRGQSDLILYRVYLEDLTVSGRTGAQVKALDEALFTKECLTVGGRFYGDTFTDPTTIP